MEWSTSILVRRSTRPGTASAWSRICIGAPRRSGLFSTPRSQHPDLGMQRLYIDRGRDRRLAPRAEHVGSPALKLGFPGGDLIGVDVEMLGQLGQCPVALDGGKRHLRLEGR